MARTMETEIKETKKERKSVEDYLSSGNLVSLSLSRSKDYPH